MEQKFFQPTPIQRLTLPAAIRDRLDIIGAAETVILVFYFPRMICFLVNKLGQWKNIGFCSTYSYPYAGTAGKKSSMLYLLYHINQKKNISLDGLWTIY